MENNAHKEIHFEQRGALGIIGLSRREALNALTLPMIRAMHQQLSAWQTDETIRAVVIYSLVEKAFCVGGDVRWLYQKGLAHDSVQLTFFEEEYALNHFIHSYPKPYIALMNGPTMGGGVGISLHGSLRIASENFLFAMPETAIGLFPDIGASYLLSQCPGKTGLYLALTGRRLNAYQAKRLGLVDYLVDPKTLYSFLDGDFTPDQVQHAALQKHDPVFEQELEPIDAFFSGRTLKEIFLKLEQSEEEWAKQTLSNLRQKSPLSLEITFHQMQKAQNLSLEDCLKMDYCLVKHFMAGKDFYEGVRALLIDKDKSPQWQHANIDTICQREIANYFE